MIKDSIDFDYAINKITEKVEPEIIAQGAILESNKFNKTFEEIEKSLNTLYEQTRYLEDAIQYARVFLDTKVKDFNEEMDSIIKELNETIDQTKNLAYLSYNVPLIQNSITINDRDNGIDKLMPLLIKDKKLILNYDSDKDIPFSSVSRKSDYIPYDDNLNESISTKRYMAIYMEEKIVKDGLKETIIVHFKEPVTLNIFDFELSNCNISNIRFGLINGIEEVAADYNLLSNNNSRTCIYIKFDIICTNYTMIEYEIDKNKITNNLWNDIKQYEIAKVANLDKVNKLNADYIISRTVTNKITNTKEKETYASSDDKTIMKLKMYNYCFGLTRFNFKHTKTQSAGYFISDYITIGKLTNKEYINLYVSQVKDNNSAIEYSILDGEKEIPIIPVNYELVENEPIFNTKDTRFERNTKTQSSNYMPEVIKKDGQLVNVSYDDAKGMSDGLYSITYKPSNNNHNYTPINNDIRIKAYVRNYGTHITTMPYIDMINIRKYGEDSLWTNKY